MKTSTAIVPITSRPVMISFLCNCILAVRQNGTFGTAAQELSDHWVFGVLEFFRVGFLNDFALIHHSHSGGDAQGAVNFMGYGNPCYAGCFGQTVSQFLDH